GCFVVIFSDSYVARCAGVPFQRMTIFRTRALLQIHISGLIENEDMNGAMAQVIPMHFGPACVAANSVIPIDHREPLFGRRAHLLAWRRRDAIRKSNPLQ